MPGPHLFGGGHFTMAVVTIHPGRVHHMGKKRRIIPDPGQQRRIIRRPVTEGAFLTRRIPVMAVQTGIHFREQIIRPPVTARHGSVTLRTGHSHILHVKTVVEDGIGGCRPGPNCGTQNLQCGNQNSFFDLRPPKA